MWDRLLDRMLSRLMVTGRLNVVYPDGTSRSYGPGGGKEVSVRLTDPALPRKLMLTTELAMGEAYMDETLLIEQGHLRDFLQLVMENALAEEPGAVGRMMKALRTRMRKLKQHNPLHISRKNVEHHYDLSVELYDLFLCDDKQYTCAYYRDPGMTLEQAQDAKKAHIAKKLRLKPGMRVMDIGCGWGGTSIALAKDYGVNVVGVTLSKVQLEHAKARAEAAGVADQIEWRLTDYRDVRDQFDRIVVIGMLEHVGQPQYDTFFRQIRRCLKPDGVAVVHTIGRSTPPGALSPWSNKYIFPGGYAPAMSEVMEAVQKHHLFAADVEVWRMHYVYTLLDWQDRFETNHDQIAAMYDERFCRMWRYYLVMSELSFSVLGMVVFQFQLTRDQQAAPLSRDYMCDGAD